jgi:cell division protein ZapA
MAQVAVHINGRRYLVACDDGEEDHLQELARHVDKHVSELANSMGQIGETRLLLMASLLIADELTSALDDVTSLKDELAKLGGTRTTVLEKAQESQDAVAKLLEMAAARIENIAEKLEAS